MLRYLQNYKVAYSCQCMRTFVDLPVDHADYDWVVRLLERIGFYVISTVCRPIKYRRVEDPVTALYVAKLVDAQRILDEPVVIDSRGPSLILVGHFDADVYPVECTFIPGQIVIRIDIRRGCIVHRQW